MLKSLLLILFLSINLNSELFAQINNPEGKIHSVNTDDIWPKTLTGNYYQEFWNYQFYFDNGMKVHLVFSVSNFGSLKSPISGIRVSIYGLDDKVYQISREYPIEDLLQDRETNLFSINPRQENVWFKGSIKDSILVYVNTAKKGERFNINLKITNIENSFKLGDGLYRINDDIVGIITHIPYSKVTGKVGINADIREVTGLAYMDHTYKHQNISKVIESGLRYVNLIDSLNWESFYYLKPKISSDDQAIGYYVKSNNGVLNIRGIVKIETKIFNTTFNEFIPEIFQLTLDDGTQLSVVRSEDQERFSVLNDLSWVARHLARAFLGGDVIDIRGTAVKIESSEKSFGEYNYFFVR